MGERTASYLYPGWKETLRWHGSNPPAGRNGREKAREDLEGRLRASGFPLFVGRGSPSQLCPETDAAPRGTRPTPSATRTRAYAAARPAGGSLPSLFSLRPGQEPDLAACLTDGRESRLPETAPQLRDNA